MVEQQIAEQWNSILEAGTLAIFATVIGLMTFAVIIYFRLQGKVSDNQIKAAGVQETVNNAFLTALSKMQTTLEHALDTREEMDTLQGNQAKIIQQQSEQVNISQQQAQVINSLNQALDLLHATITAIKETQATTNKQLDSIIKTQDSSFSELKGKLKKMDDGNGEILSELRQMNTNFKLLMDKLVATMDTIQMAMARLGKLERLETDDKPEEKDADAPA
jgi:chromosome segregation ATPase